MSHSQYSTRQFNNKKEKSSSVIATEKANNIDVVSNCFANSATTSNSIDNICEQNSHQKSTSTLL